MIEEDADHQFVQRLIDKEFRSTNLVDELGSLNFFDSRSNRSPLGEGMKELTYANAIRDVASAVLEPSLWIQALRSVAFACNSSTPVIEIVGPKEFRALTNDEGVDILKKYVGDGWHVDNPRANRGIALTKAGFKGLITERNSFTDEELARQPYQQEFAAKHGLDHEAGILAAEASGSALILTLSRNLKAGAFSPDELRDMNRLVAGISTALHFALKLKLAASATILDTLGARGEAAALLSATGRVLHATQRFEDLMRGRLIAIRDGRVSARDHAQQLALKSLIDRALSWSGMGLPAPVLLTQPEQPALVVRCLPVAGAVQDLLALGRVLMLVEGGPSPDHERRSEHLRILFGLTPAEARFATKIADGRTLAECSTAEGITIQTARSRLKVVFEKTGAHRQAELAVLVHNVS